MVLSDGSRFDLPPALSLHTTVISLANYTVIVEQDDAFFANGRYPLLLQVEPKRVSSEGGQHQPSPQGQHPDQPRQLIGRAKGGGGG